MIVTRDARNVSGAVSHACGTQWRCNARVYTVPCLRDDRVLRVASTVANTP